MIQILVTKVRRDKFNRYVVGGGVKVCKIIGLPDQRRTTYDPVTFRTEVVPDLPYLGISESNASRIRIPSENESSGEEKPET